MRSHFDKLYDKFRTHLTNVSVDLGLDVDLSVLLNPFNQSSLGKSPKEIFAALDKILKVDGASPTQREMVSRLKTDCYAAHFAKLIDDAKGKLKSPISKQISSQTKSTLAKFDAMLDKLMQMQMDISDNYAGKNLETIQHISAQRTNDFEAMKRTIREMNAFININLPKAERDGAKKIFAQLQIYADELQMPDTKNLATLIADLKRQALATPPPGPQPPVSPVMLSPDLLGPEPLIPPNPTPSAFAAFQRNPDPQGRALVGVDLSENLATPSQENNQWSQWFCNRYKFTELPTTADNIKQFLSTENNIAITVDPSGVKAKSLPSDEDQQYAMIRAMTAIYIKSIEGKGVTHHLITAATEEQKRDMESHLGDELAKIYKDSPELATIKINGKTLAEIKNPPVISMSASNADQVVAPDNAADEPVSHQRPS